MLLGHGEQEAVALVAAGRGRRTREGGDEGDPRIGRRGCSGERGEEAGES